MNNRALVAGCFFLFVSSSGAVEPLINARQKYGREMNFGREMRQARENLIFQKRTEETQAGKDGIDLDGRRVRYEQYIQRPAPNQVEKRFLTRREGRTDQLTYTTVFNRDLPLDLRDVYRGTDFALFGGTYYQSSVPLNYYPTHTMLIATNGQDKYTEEFSGGTLYAPVSTDNRVYFDNIYRTFNDKIKWHQTRTGQNPATGWQGTATDYYPDASGGLTSTVPPLLINHTVVGNPGHPISMSDTYRYLDGSLVTQRVGFFNEDLERSSDHPSGGIFGPVRQNTYSATEFGDRTVDTFSPYYLYTLP